MHLPADPTTVFLHTLHKSNLEVYIGNWALNIYYSNWCFTHIGNNKKLYTMDHLSWSSTLPCPLSTINFRCLLPKIQYYTVCRPYRFSIANKPHLPHYSLQFSIRGPIRSGAILRGPNNYQHEYSKHQG